MVTKKTQKYKPNKRTRKHKKRKNNKKSVIKNTNPKRKSSKKKNKKLKKQRGGDGEKFSIEVYEFLLAGYPKYPEEKSQNLDGISIGKIKTREANEANEANESKEENKINYYKVSDEIEQTDNKVYSPDVVFNSEQAGGWTKGLFKQYYEKSKAKTLYPEESVLFEGDHKDKLITLLIQLLEKTTELQHNIYKTTGTNIKHEKGFIYKTKVGKDEKIITFGDFHGSYHTFFRHMIRLETLGILIFEPSELSEPIDTIEKLVEKLVDKLNLENLPKIKIVENYRLLFLGDILDRGMHALEIVIFILILIWSNNKKGEEPKIIYNRGNHEEHEQFVDEGFYDEVIRKLINDFSLLSTFIYFFTSCPSAVILQHGEGKNITNIWCCHGGIPYLQKQKSINKLKSSLEKFKILNLLTNIAEQVRWNDLNVNETTLGPRSEGAGPDWAIDQDTLKTILSTLNIDFLIRGHQDYNGNTVLFVEKNNTTMIKQFLNGLDIQDIMRPKADEPIASTLSSELEEFKSKSVNPIGSIQYKTDNTKLSYNFAKPGETNAIEPKTNDYQQKIKDLKAITISTNTDYGRPLTRDSFVVIKFNQ